MVSQNKVFTFKTKRQGKKNKKKKNVLPSDVEQTVNNCISVCKVAGV